MPATIKEFATLEPVYEMLKGWKKDTRKVKRFDELPTEAQSFVKFIEQRSKKEVTFVSTSADENEGMLRTRLN
jgi:adenylosuccinate synthase